MHKLLSTTCFASLAMAGLSAPAMAQLTISTSTTTPVSTATAVNGAPADINVTADGYIKLSSGAAVTVNSNNKVTNAGGLEVGGNNGATGINKLGGTTGDITSSGKIIVIEDFVAANDDANSIVDGPIAKATDRAGIRLRAGGTHVGNVTNSGSITIEGLNSAGIRIDDDLTGSLANSGTIGVVGDYSVGIQAGKISGNVDVRGSVVVVGEGATAINLTDDIGGYVNLQNVIGQKATYVNDTGATMGLSRNDLRVGAPAVAIGGNVGGGIIIAKPPTASSTNTDVDGDGVLDANEATGLIQSFGNGPALLIGSGKAITIGTVSGNTHGLVNNGTIQGTATYSSTDAIALQIGGKGGAVVINGGISNTGTIAATTVDSAATALLIESGANVSVIDNSGSIKAGITSPGEGATYGIRDLSGTLTTINTNGFITVNGTADDISYAIDLGANTSGVTINQFSPPDETADQEKQITTAITGNIRTGSGNDIIKVADGAIVGNSFLGAGDDQIQLSGDAIYSGKADFGTGTGTLSLIDTAAFSGTAIFNDAASTLSLGGTSSFTGLITGGANLAVNVNSGTFQPTGNISVNALNVGANGTIKVALNGTNHTSPQITANSATFASGAKVAATVTSLAQAEGNYVIVKAPVITGSASFASDVSSLPFLFKGSVAVDNTAGTMSVNIARKSTDELGLNRSQASAYSAILAAAATDTQVEGSLLQASTADSLKSQFRDLLPDHAGGNFDMLVRGSRLASRHLTNNNTIFDISDWGGWLEVLKWANTKNEGNTASYRASGWGFSGGLERNLGFGRVGLSVSWLSGKNANRDNANSVKANTYEFGLFWRHSVGPLYAFARASYARSNFTGTRVFDGTLNSTDFQKTTTGKWSGQMFSGMAGVSYQFDFGDQLSVKPMAVIDYFKLKEDGYTEAGGGTAVDLVVDARDTDTMSAATTITGIYRFGSRTPDGIPLTIELEGGRRNSIGGKAGNTVAHFANGTNFTLAGDKMADGWMGEVRLLSGGLDYTWTISGNVEETGAGTPAYGARISFGVAF